METSISNTHRRARRANGFALIETVIAIAILAVGLLGVAALLAQLMGTTTNSRYGGVEASLASEKLEDLNRRPALDPAIAVPGGTGTSAGSLTADTSQSVTASGVTETVAYYDDIQISSGNGGITETVKSGSSTYTVTTHTPDGTVTTTTPSTAPAPSNDMLTFHRRWLIEQDPAGLPVGVRRITVVVNLTDGTAATSVPFQMTTVRP